MSTLSILITVFFNKTLPFIFNSWALFSKLIFLSGIIAVQQ